MSAIAGHGASVRLDSCGKTFADGTRALESATLDIARGETLVLLGPSGCGKTTMLRIIAGLELPDARGRGQRVALARAVAIRPGILLLDEPLAALDAALRDRLRGELNRLLRALGITTIYVTHDQSEAMELGDRIVVMQKGAIAQIGTPREIYFKPRNRFVAEFIGAANIIEAPVENGHLVLPGGRLPIGGEAKLSAAVAMIRPETIRVVEAASATLSGTIDSVSFIGDRQRMIVSGASAKPLTVDAPNTIKARAGERVVLLIAPDAIRLLPSEN